MREARERDARVAVGHARRLPVLRPVGEQLVPEPEVAVAALDLIQRPIAQHLRELAEVLLVALVVRARLRRMAGRCARAEGLLASCARTPCPSRASAATADSRAARRRASASLFPVNSMLKAGYGVFQMLVCGVALVLEVAEVVQLVRDDRAADGRAVLLVLDRARRGGATGILRVEAAVAEVGCGTGPRAGWCPTS